MKRLNILIQSEDKYGCTSLLQEALELQDISTDMLKINENLVTIRHGLNNVGVFKIDKRTMDNFDYIIVLFDMDSQIQNENVMTINRLTNLLKDKENYADKIILVPVFFCYESLILYSEEAVGILKDIKNNKYGFYGAQCVKQFLNYYAYDNIENSEDLFNIGNNIIKMQEIAYKMSNTTDSNRQWYPQTFHTTIYKNIFKAITIGTNIDEKKLKKHENKLFKYLKDKELYDIHKWIDDIKIYAVLNVEFATLLKFNTDILRKMTMKYQLDNLKIKVEAYEKYINGTKVIKGNKELSYKRIFEASKVKYLLPIYH